MARLVTKNSGVLFKEFTPAMVTMLAVLQQLTAVIDYMDAVVITSANDSTHSPGSRHYTNEALDIRVHNFPDPYKLHAFIDSLRSKLGAKFTVLYELPGTGSAHIHIQVKKGTEYA